MVAAIAGVATVAGSVISSSATSSAAKGQQAATNAANAEQARQYDNNVALQAPTINTGNAARDRLSYLLGLSPTGYSGTTSVGGVGGQSAGSGSAGNGTYDSIRNELLSQFTRQSDPAPQPANPGFQYGGDGDNNLFGAAVSNGSTTSVDNAGLEAAIQSRLAQQEQARQASQAAAASDPNYGRLAQEYVPEKFSYTGEDLYNDPSYQFRLDQGQKALDRQGAASGRFLSGSQLQASSNYNQAAASQEYGNAYNRALQTFGTNEGNRANAFQSNFNNAVNPLLSLSGAATLGSQNLGAAGLASANATGQNLTANANAQGAAGIANANNISGALTSGVQNYQQNQLLNGLLNNRGVNNNPYAGGTYPNPNAYDFTRD